MVRSASSTIGGAHPVCGGVDLESVVLSVADLLLCWMISLACQV